MPLINIRGTHGSGKSTIARNLLSHPAVLDTGTALFAEDRVLSPTKANPNREVVKKINGVTANLHNSKAIALMGSYDNNCGGCDKFSWKGAHDSIVDGIVAASSAYDAVIFEGAIVSSSFGRYAEACLRADLHPTFVYLLIDVEECIARIGRRSGTQVSDRLTHNVTKKAEHMVRQAETARQFAAENPHRFDVEVFTDSSEAEKFIQSLVFEGKS